MTNKLDPGIVMTKLDYIQRDLVEIKMKLEKDYVTKDEFDPIKKVVYGLVSIMLAALIGSVLSLVIK